MDEPLYCDIKPFKPETFLYPVRNGALYDLFLQEDVTIKSGERVMIGLGFAMKMPPQKHAKIYMRSSSWGRYGIMLTDPGNVLLTNGVGVIDNAYCGDNDEWKLSVYKKRSDENTITIPAGTRIAQMEIVDDMPDIVFRTVTTLGESRGGFGSTGK